MNKIEEIYVEADLYEAENSVMMRDLNFWETIISSYYSADVLEIGCGTGRIARQIIDSIHSYVGIDISTHFLSYFKNTECFKHNIDKISLEEIDYRNFETEKTFDIIMLSSQFPGHIYNYMDFHRLLKKLSLMLKYGGKAVIDYCNPDLRFLNNHKSYEFCYQFPFNGNIKVFEKNTYFQVEQINYEYRKYVFPNGKEILQEIPFRIYFPQELDAIFELSGFNIDAKYGDYDFSEYKEYCNKQIYILSLEN